MANLASKPEVATLLRCIASLLKLRYDEAGADAAGASSGAAAAAGGGAGLMAKFMAARSKIDVQGRKGKGGGAPKPERALRIFDPTATDGVPPQGDVLACRLPEDCAAPLRARLVRALKSGAAGYHLVLADDFEQVGADAQLCALLLRSAAAFFVVPATPEHGGQVLFCGGAAMATAAAAYDKCTAAVVAQAKRDKSVGSAFCKLAQRPERLGELLGAGAAAARRLHLFSRTAEALRSQLQLDAEAHYSVTDEEMADRLTDEVARLAGVSVQSTTIVDGTACVGGNALSFAKVFERVVAIESDATRLAMLRHNATVLGRANVRCLGGDCLEELPKLRRKGSDDGGDGGSDDGFVVFLDPPWGGLSYKDQDSCELELSDTPFPEVVSRFLRLRGCRWCICKVPFNFDRSTLRGLPGAATAEPPRLLSMSKSVKCIFVRAAAAAAALPMAPAAPARVPDQRPAAAAPSDGEPKKKERKKKRARSEGGESGSVASVEGQPIKKKKKKKKTALPPPAM